MRGPIYFLFYVQEMATEIDKTKDRHIEEYFDFLRASDHRVQCFVQLAHQFHWVIFAAIHHPLFVISYLVMLI